MGVLACISGSLLGIYSQLYLLYELQFQASDKKYKWGTPIYLAIFSHDPLFFNY